MGTEDRELYRACAADFRALLRMAAAHGGPAPTARAICDLVGRQRGLAIEVYPASLGGHPYGLVLRGKDLAIILHERHATAWHQEVIILHECGHIFYDHQGTEEGTAAALRVLVPDMSGQRGCEEGHRPEDERQAETFATVGLEWLSRAAARPADLAPPPPPTEPEVAAVLRRLLADFAGEADR